MKESVDWLFAYGSLIFSESRDLSFKTNTAIPAWAYGYKRGWSSGNNNEISGLGVVACESEVINGVLLQLSSSELLCADDRELSFGYERKMITNNSLRLASGALGNNDKIWIYTTKLLSIPNSHCPLFQSYLDVVLAGCLDISNEFAIEFIQTTKFWGGIWIDDRKSPKYIRAFNPEKYQEMIDYLLKKEIAESFNKRIKLSV